VLLPLDPAADRDDALGLRKIDRLLRFFERRLGPLPDGGGVHADRRLADGGRRGAALRGVGAVSPDLDRDQMRRRTFRADVRRELPLEDGTHVEDPGAVRAQAGDVGDQRAPEARRQRRREVARLIRVGEKDVRRAFRID